MRRLRLAGAAAAALLLGACATVPKTPPPSARPVPAPAATTLSPAPARAVPATTAAPDFWTALRRQFRMPGCNADPEVVHWARRLTRRPRAFEAQLRWALPTLTYIAQSARAHHVAGEFVLLPWVESRFRAEWPHRGGSAGMWQIVPITARSLGLPITRGYDARLDRVAATDAVMGMLQRYDRRWHDWRLVDMAYNAGEYRIRRDIDSGPAPAHPLIPRLHVSRITRYHLLQLLAMACVIRQPKRFGVTLPAVNDETRLAVIELSQPVNLATAARLAGLPEHRVHTLNAAYLRGRMPADAPHRIVLPASHAAAFRKAYALLLAHPRKGENAPLVILPPRYVIARGDSLWSIAHRFHLSVKQLRHWNHLRGSLLRPGHVLRLHPRR